MQELRPLPRLLHVQERFGSMIGDYWHNTMRSTVHIERDSFGTVRYWCGMAMQPKHTRAPTQSLELSATGKGKFMLDAKLCNRCLQNKGVTET